MFSTNKIFVFGSNLKGIHGRGAALKAYERFGAILGRGEGMSGNSYVIPTKVAPWVFMSLEEIERGVKKFLETARSEPDLTFYVTQIGCGLGGKTKWQIAPMFKDAPKNCLFDPEWAIFGYHVWEEGMDEGYK